jgi:phenylacetate-CoA ligase
MNQYWNKQAETMSRDALAALQADGLEKLVARVYARVPHYRQKMDAAGILPGDIKKLDDIKHLPFTVKDDLRDTYPFGLFAVPLEDIVRIHASSGTTGKQTVVGYTEHDLDTWADCMARCLVMAGATKKSMIQVCYGYGLFVGGLGVHYGVEKMGATTIPPRRATPSVKSPC